jgi:hypothetical protein
MIDSMYIQSLSTVNLTPALSTGSHAEDHKRTWNGYYRTQAYLHFFLGINFGGHRTPAVSDSKRKSTEAEVIDGWFT